MRQNNTAAKEGCHWLPHGVNFLVPEPRRLWVYFHGAIPQLYLPRLHRQVELQNYKRGTMAISVTSCLQAVERSKFASYCLEESKRRPGKPEPPIEAVGIDALLGAGELEARAMMLAREVDRRREQLLTKTMAAILR